MLRIKFSCTIFILSIVSLNSIGQSLNDFTLNGIIQGKAPSKIYLVLYTPQEERTVDSAHIVEGKFQFTGNSYGYNDRAYIKLDPKQMYNYDSLNAVQIRLDNSVMTLHLTMGQFSKYKLEGCKACEEHDLFHKQAEEKTQRWHYLKVLRSLPDDNDSLNNALSEKVDSLGKEYLSLQLNHCEQNRQSKIVPILLTGVIENLKYRQMDSIRRIFINDNNINDFYTWELLEIIRKKRGRMLSLGATMPSFNTIDINENKLDLKSYAANKAYTIMVLSATWCVPCKMLKNDLYPIVKNMGNDKVGVLIVETDNIKRDVWKSKILKKDKSWYIHILDNSLYTDVNEKIVLEKYLHIASIPYAVVLDNQLKIVKLIEGYSEENIKLIEQIISK